jgi:hypothetical protein
MSQSVVKRIQTPASPTTPTTPVAGDELNVSALATEAGRLGENHRGQVVASSAAAHPFFSACTMLKAALSIIAVLVVATAVVVSFTTDPAQQHFTMFTFNVLLFVPTLLLFHSARMQEWMICVRAYHARAESYLDTQLPTAFTLFYISEAIQLVAAFAEIYNGQLEEWAIWATSLSSCLLTLLAIVFVRRAEKLLIIDNLGRQ